MLGIIPHMKFSTFPLAVVTRTGELRVCNFTIRSYYKLVATLHR